MVLISRVRSSAWHVRPLRDALLRRLAVYVVVSVRQQKVTRQCQQKGPQVEGRRAARRYYRRHQ